MLTDRVPRGWFADYNNKLTKYSRTDSEHSSTTSMVLLPPPDVRRVLLKKTHQYQGQQPHRQEPGQQVHNKAQRPEISPHNTMIIGDYTSVVFLNSNKWLVQAFGNATFQSMTDAIIEESVKADKKYVFVQLGGNQIRSANKQLVFNQLLKLIIVIRDKSPDSKIFVVGVLPRPIENDSAKPFIVKFNRWLKSACDRMGSFYANITFIPAQLSFIDGKGPKLQYYDEQDKLTLNNIGARLFKEILFTHAGFVKNT